MEDLHWEDRRKRGRGKGEVGRKEEGGVCGMGRGRGWKILTVLLHTFFAGPSVEEGQGDPEDDPGRKGSPTKTSLASTAPIPRGRR